MLVLLKYSEKLIKTNGDKKSFKKFRKSVDTKD